MCRCCNNHLFLSTTILIALAIRIDAGISFRQIWKEKFSWLTPYYISMGLIAYALILGYQTTGFIGLAVIMIPLLMLRLSVKQYIDRTISMVNELRGKNQLLEKSSDEITLLNEDLLVALAEVIDLRDPFTLGHSQYVTRYSLLLAKKLGLPVFDTFFPHYDNRILASILIMLTFRWIRLYSLIAIKTTMTLILHVSAR